MRIETSNNATDITNTSGEVREFSIEVNPVAFSLLSQKLYSRPVEAVIRELICNAYDAHVAAGTLDKAISVGLPTSLMPEFTVTDFGTGLSDSDVMRLYTTFFASNKRDSNSSIGGFGLGSKSPFAVADSFTVESRFNGVKSTYLATKDSGAPKLVRMASVATSEPCGMTIRVPVKYNFDDWHLKTKLFAGTFGHPINGIGGFTNPYTDKNNTYLQSVLFRRDGSSAGQSLIRVGNTVTYPNKNFDSFFNSTIVDMSIGQLTIAPTREELVFDDATKTAISTHLETVKALIVTGFQAMFKDIDTRFDTPAEATLAAIKAADEYLPQRMEYLVQQLTWRGKKLNPTTIPANLTNARLGVDFKSFLVPMGDLHAFKVRLRSNDYAQLSKHELRDVVGNPVTGTNDVELYSWAYGRAFDPQTPWVNVARSYDPIIVAVDEPVSDYSDKVLLKRLRSAIIVSNRKGHATYRGGLTLLLMPEAYVKELATVFWMKDYTTEPYLKDKVVRLSELVPYEQPKQVRVGTAPKRTNFHEFVKDVGVRQGDYTKLELDYDTNLFGTGPLLFVPMTYSGMFQEQKNRLSKAVNNVLGKQVYLFMDKARKAYDAAPPQVKAKWLNLLDADAVVNNVLLTNPKFKAEVYKQSSILPELPEWFKYHTKLDDVRVKNFMAKVNSTLSTEYTYNYETFYEGIPDNSVVQAVKAKVEALRNSMRASLEVELKLALNPYQPYLQSISCGSGESVVKLVNLVYNSVTKGVK